MSEENVVPAAGEAAGESAYRVLMPICVAGVMLGPGTVVELDLPTAKAYSHALIAVKEGK